MNYRNALTICIASALLLSCGVMRRGGASHDDGQARGYAPQTTASFYYTEGIKNTLMGGDTERSAELFGKVLAIDSLHAPSLFELASLYAPTDPEKAFHYSQKAAAQDTSNSWYRMQLGRLMIATQRYDSALVFYRSLLETNPDEPDNYRLLAALYEQQDQPYKALAALDSAESRIGRTEMLTSYKRQLLLNLKQYDRALLEALTLVTEFPYDEGNFVALAETYAVLGRDSLAKQAYDKALTINPGSIRTIVSLNEFYKQKKDNLGFLSTAAQIFRSPELPLETKLKFYDELIKGPNFYRDYYFQIGNLASALAVTYPGDYRTTELYARHLIAGGSLEEALKLYKARLGDSVPNREAFNSVMDIEAYLKHPDSVARYAGEALLRFPGDPELYLRKGGVTSFYLKDYKAAEADYKLALKYAKSDSLRSAIYGMLGDNSQTQGDFRQCFAYYDKALKLDSANAVVNNNYAYFLSLREERLEKALHMAQRTNRLSPNNPTYLDTYAWVLYQLGRYEEARTPMKLAISLDGSDNKELYLHYGDILYKLKDNFMASYYWKKAQESGYEPAEIEKRLKLIEK